MDIKIDMREWFDLTRTLRGEEYFYDGKVRKLKKEGEEYSARVYGSRMYDVSIKVDDENNVVGMHCNCPYAREAHCKHMAAVIYEILNNYEEKEINKEIDYSNIIDSIPKEKIKDFFINNILVNETLANKFKKEFYEYFPKISKEEYLSKIGKEMKYAAENFKCYYNDDYYDDYDDYNGYYEDYDYQPSGNTISELLSKYESETIKSINKKDYKTTYYIASAFLETLPIGKVKFVDEYFNEFDMINLIVYKVSNIFDSILNGKISEEFREEIFKFFIQKLNDKKIVIYLQPIIKNLINNFPDNEKYIEEKVKIMLKVLPKFKHYVYEYGYRDQVEYLKKLIEYLNRLNRKEEAFCVIKENLDEREIFDKYVEYFLENKQYEEAINILGSKIKDLERDYSYYEYEKYIDKLLNVYEISEKMEEYKKIVENMIYIKDIGSLKYYIKLKNMYSNDEWKKIQNNVISKIEETIKDYNSDTLRKLYIEEKLYDKLFVSVMAKPEYNTLVKYEQYLKKDYSKVLLEKYKKIADKQSLNVGRNNYEYLQNVLHHMKGLIGGKEVVKELIDKYIEKYPTRRLMKELLQQIK